MPALNLNSSTLMTIRGGGTAALWSMVIGVTGEADIYSGTLPDPKQLSHERGIILALESDSLLSGVELSNDFPLVHLIGSNAPTDAPLGADNVFEAAYAIDSGVADVASLITGDNA